MGADNLHVGDACPAQEGRCGLGVREPAPTLDLRTVVEGALDPRTRPGRESQSGEGGLITDDPRGRAQGVPAKRDARARDVELDELARDGRRGVRGGLRSRVAGRPEGPPTCLACYARGTRYPARFDPGKWGRRALASSDPERAMRISAELRDYEAAGSLA